MEHHAGNKNISMDSSFIRDANTDKISQCEEPALKGTAQNGINELRSMPPHTYRDHANSTLVPAPAEVPMIDTKSRGGVVNPFPLVLHTLLERAEVDHYSQIVSWKPHGRSFQVHDKERFAKQILPLYFRQTQFGSFQRQLNLYSFRRLTRKSPDYGR